MSSEYHVVLPDGTEVSEVSHEHGVVSYLVSVPAGAARAIELVGAADTLVEAAGREPLR